MEEARDYTERTFEVNRITLLYNYHAALKRADVVLFLSG